MLVKWNTVNAAKDGPKKFRCINGVAVLYLYKKIIVLAFFGDKDKWP